MYQGSSNNTHHSPKAVRYKPCKLMISLVLCLCLVMSLGTGLCGCGVSETNNTIGNTVNSPQTINYFIPNHLDLNQVTVKDYPDENAPDEFYFSYLEVSGLKDKDVEQKINDRIKEKAYEMLDKIPPQRGINQILGADYEIHYNSVYSYEYFNNNNILSISFSGGKSMYTDKAIPGSVNINDYYIFWDEYLTFDLNTGNELKISDLFCNDVDYIAFLNDYVSKYITENAINDSQWEDAIINKNASIHGDQKFYLSSYGPSLCFDYESDYINLSYNTNYIITVPWNENMAVTERFYDGTCIYEDETPVTPVFALYGMENHMDRDILNEKYNGKSIFVSKSMNVNETLPAFCAEMVKEEYDEINLTEEAKSLHGLADESSSQYISKDIIINANRFGNYASIHRYENSYWDTFLDFYSYRNYDLSTGELLELEDIFVDGADYKTLLADGLMRDINNLIVQNNDSIENGYSAYPYQEEFTNFEYVKGLVENITSFRLNTSDIMLSYDTEAVDQLYLETFGIARDEDPASYIFMAPGYIPFDTLGYENLALFK